MLKVREVDLATTLVQRVRLLTDRDVAGRANLKRVPAWRRRVALTSGDRELIETDLLLRALVLFWSDGYDEASAAHSLATRPHSGKPPTCSSWLYWNFAGLFASAHGALDESLALHERAAEVARSLGIAEYLEVSLTNMGYVCEKLGRFDESLQHLSTVIRESSDDTSIAVAREVWAESLDRFQLYDLSLPHWITALERIPASETNLRTRILVGLVRSVLHAETDRESWVERKVVELRATLAMQGVSAEVRARSGVALGWWAAKQGDCAEASRLLSFYGGPLLANGFPVHTVEAAHLQALIASFEGRFADVETALDAVDASKASTHDMEATLRVLIRAQKREGALQHQDETYQRLASLQSAVSRDRERMAYFAQTRQIAALEHSRTLLREAMSDRDGLLRVLSHELRGPLTTMSLDLGRLRTTSGTGELRSPRLVNQAYDHMVEIVDHLSLIGQVEGAALAVHLDKLDVSLVVSQSCDRVARSIASKSQRLTWSAPDRAILCTADSRWLSIILDNFLGNATKFCDRGDQIVVSVERSARAVTINVSDTGPGFDQSEKPKLFRQYSRLSATPTAGEPTNGLGLYLSAQVASKMGATIDASSDGRGQGASFTLRLPL